VEKPTVIWDLVIEATLEKLESPVLWDESVPFESAPMTAPALTPRFMAHRPQVVPAFSSGTQMEYFSSTHGNFVPCMVVGTELAKGPDGQQYFNYSVQLKSGQKRDKVTMNSLRLPFTVGEAVESLTRNGPQSCNVQGYDGAVGRKGTVYSLLKDSSVGMSSQRWNVSSVHMRRRFRDGEELECYLGPVRGWRPVVVEGESGSAKEDTVEPLVSLTFLEKPFRVRVLPDDWDEISEVGPDINELLLDDGPILDLSTSSESSTKTPPSSGRTPEASADARPGHVWKCVEDSYDVASRLGAHGSDVDTHDPQQRLLLVPPHLLRRRMLAKQIDDVSCS
jgi:hypothetical protein